MPRHPALACSQCADERSRESRYGARVCEACGIEFRPRERVPIRCGSPVTGARWDGWPMMFAIMVVFGLLGVGLAIDTTPTSAPPTTVDPIVIPSLAISPIFDPSFAVGPLEPPSVDVVTHRFERRAGRVEATGLLAIQGRNVARPQVHVGFLGPEGVEIGAVLADVACSRIDTLPCPWGFSGSEPAGTSEVRIRASGDTDMGDLHPVARLRLGFDDEFDATTIESNLPELAEVEGWLIPHEDEGEIEVRVSLPAPNRLRAAKAMLVGYAEASQVELVVPMPSPVGLSRRVVLPEHERAIVRWQLWIDGPTGGL
jgi:hypothetical protein